MIFSMLFLHSKSADVFLSKVQELFDTKNEALDFVTEYDLDVARATLLRMAGRPADAADIHIAEGRITEGIHIFLENLTNDDCTHRAVDHVLRALWQHLSFGISTTLTVTKPDTLLGHWLGLAAQLNSERLKAGDRDEVRANT
jgi:hypothetical protein